MSYKNILITGGAGFIGSHLCQSLIDLGYKVKVLDTLSEQIHSENSFLLNKILGKVELIKGNVTNRLDWERAIEDIDVVVHLAAETGTGQSMYEIAKYTDVNIQGTSILLDIIANQKTSIKKIVVASSRSIYGEGAYFCKSHKKVYPKQRSLQDLQSGFYNPKCPFCHEHVDLLATDEESLIHPSSIYGITKQVQEQMIMLMGQSLGLPTVSLRYQNVYGAGQSLKNPYTGIFSIFSSRLINNSDIFIFEDGLESRDFIYVTDVVDATIKSIEQPEANYNIFNVGSGKPTSVLEIAEELKKAYSSTSKIKITGEFRVGDIRHNFADISKIQKKLNFKPNVSLQSGVKKFADWVITQEPEIDLYEKSLHEMKKKGLLK